MSSLPSITVHEAGPCECMRAIAFKLLWANTDLSAGSLNKMLGYFEAFDGTISILLIVVASNVFEY